MTIDNRRLVMRKKPAGVTLRSAHAIDREYRVLKALSDSDVPVPRALLYCDDDSIVGTPFYVMDRLEGRIFADAALPGVSPAERKAMYFSMAETLATKPTFRKAWREGQRSVLLMDGYLEWITRGNVKLPQLFEVDGGEPFALGGLWEDGTRKDGEKAGQVVRTATVITVPANAVAAEVHDRMPLVLTGPAIEQWLSGTAAEAEELLGEASDVVGAAVTQALRDGARDIEVLSRHARKALGKFVGDRTKRRPMIVPVVLMV